MDKIKILHLGEYKVEQMPWGSLTWFASKEGGNSESITLGKCVIKPGCSNPRHYHPNCEEVLHVIEGTIIHSFLDTDVKMEKGSTIIISSNKHHNATNIGAEDAVMIISFSSNMRETVGED